MSRAIPRAPCRGQLVHAMVAGASFIDDADVLRSGATAAVLGHKVMAPSTLGTFLRRCSFGHVRQLDKLSEAMLARAWSLGAGPGEEEMTIDLDSTICPVHGDHKQGAGFGYTHVLGYHPLLATRAETGEALHVRFRKGSAGSGRGAERFVRENDPAGFFVGPGTSGLLTLHADSGAAAATSTKPAGITGPRTRSPLLQNPVVKRAIEESARKTWTPIEVPSLARPGHAPERGTLWQG